MFHEKLEFCPRCKKELHQAKYDHQYCDACEWGIIRRACPECNQLGFGDHLSHCSKHPLNVQLCAVLQRVKDLTAENETLKDIGAERDNAEVHAGNLEKRVKELETAQGELEVWLCPVHKSLDESRALRPLDNCVVCIRNQRDELLRASVTAVSELQALQATDRGMTTAHAYAGRAIAALSGQAKQEQSNG